MELELHRIDLLQTSAAAPGTLVVLPPGENKTQKIAVGDLSGVVQCFSIKKGEVALAFKTLPSPQKVTAMCLGRGQKQRDKIFVAASNTVRGVTKKGKEFFRFTSALTEAITHLRVVDSHIWAGCQFVYNHFIEGADKGLYMAPDKIVATDLLPLAGMSEWLPVVACRDCCIRIMGMDGKPKFEVATGSPPTAVRYVPDVHGPAAAAAARSNARELLYGCQDGRLVQLLVDASTVRQGFVIPGQTSSGEIRAAVTAIHCGADYSKTGCADIVLGREDGSLELWDVDNQGNPQLVVFSQLPESITSVDGGYITSAASPDIVVHTFTGKVIAFASHPGAMIIAAAEQRALKSVGSIGRPAPQQDLVAAMNAKIAKETAELAELRAKVAKERERYAANQTSSLSISQAVVDVRHRLSLQPQDGCFVLLVEAAVSLFALALHSTVPLKLLDLPGNVAILSRSPPDLAAGNATLATYRCQESTNRLSIKFTTCEGQPGKIVVYTLPAIPPKTCSVIEVQLHPLCMHQMVSTIPGARASAEVIEASGPVQKLMQTRPCSELGLQGSFDVQDIHAWLHNVLPDIPVHLPSGSSSGSYLFRECHLGSMLGCQYGAGQATFACESITALAILHDSLLAAATAAKERVSINYKLHPAAVQHCCGLLWPQLEAQKALARQHQLAAALQELQTQEGDASFLAPEYRQILSHKEPGSRKTSADDIAAEQLRRAGDSNAASKQQELDAAVETFKQLFKDYSRFSTGGAVAMKQHLQALEKLLRGTGQDCGLQDVIKFVQNIGK